MINEENNITNAGYLFDKCIETTLSNCVSSLQMMEYLFMTNEFEGDKEATEGVHAQLNTIKSALKYSVEVLEQNRAQDHKMSKQAELEAA